MEKKSGTWKSTIIKIIVGIIIVSIGAFFVYFYLPYGDSSVKAGQLNYVMHKGIFFKTYEGKLIQTGFKSPVSGGVQSNEFEFSIKNKELAQKLMSVTGKDVKLHYKEYFGALPWRGYTKYIVDSIISIEDMPSQN
ncbi:hypothetical protein O2K51_11420 [Apibacter raozihei]|uniref:hypothetical protein n=1 Tax=Apibacter TaxID=1778601 RepID=UPI000FE3F80D|nr:MULTISPECIES: hypothetical protein [Apibacter]